MRESPQEASKGMAATAGATKLRPPKGDIVNKYPMGNLSGAIPASKFPLLMPFSSTMTHDPKRVGPAQAHCLPATQLPLRPEAAALTFPWAAGPGRRRPDPSFRLLRPHISLHSHMPSPDPGPQQSMAPGHRSPCHPRSIREPPKDTHNCPVDTYPLDGEGERRESTALI